MSVASKTGYAFQSLIGTVLIAMLLALSLCTACFGEEECRIIDEQNKEFRTFMVALYLSCMQSESGQCEKYLLFTAIDDDSC
ncbi:MAG: hypothetical protein KDK30_03895 [Leptospiraceae bacterium]|nr:hypothetical protein [Leptospiraceae bacterium]MCB1318026.1 hypothetical protein [Leptospiraceae bacterium]